MIKLEEHTTYTQHLNQGITINELPPNTSTTAQIKHNDIRDIILQYQYTEVNIISLDTLKFMRAWGLARQINRLHNMFIRFDTYHYDSSNESNALIYNFNPMSDVFKYKCDSRIAFATLNQIKNSLNMLKNMSQTQKGIIITPTENILLHYCLQPIEHASHVLKEFTNRNLAIRSTLTILDSPRFKHKLKMIHPCTTWPHDESLK